MQEFDATRVYDDVLAETYFDLLDNGDRVNEDFLEQVRTELEDRDILFEGYRIYNWTSGYQVRGCIHCFKLLTDLKDYILGGQGIEPTIDGSMRYISKIEKKE